jgi:hypothetical protein
MPSTGSTIAGTVFASSFLCVYSSYAKLAAATCTITKHWYLLDTHLPFQAAELVQNKVNECQETVCLKLTWSFRWRDLPCLRKDLAFDMPRPSRQCGGGWQFQTQNFGLPDVP